MPFPNPDTQFKPGQTGNPNGHSKARRITAALVKLLDEVDADGDLARTIFAVATGRKSMLKDPKTGEIREPDLGWMKLLVERIEGKIPDELKVHQEQSRPHKIEEDDSRFVAGDEQPTVAGDQAEDPPA